MRDHIQENPQADLRALKACLRVLDPRDLPPDPNVLEHGCTLGKDMIPYAFSPDSDTPGPNSNALELVPNAPELDLDAFAP